MKHKFHMTLCMRISDCDDECHMNVAQENGAIHTCLDRIQSLKQSLAGITMTLYQKSFVQGKQSRIN